MNSNPFFSIVLPAYNAECFLVKTLNSIVSQGFKAYELLLVNDGSTDGTLKICQEFASASSQIKLIDKINEGVAIARNVALKNAKGRYVLFVDADDVFFPNALEFIHDELLRNEVDYLRYEFQTIDIEDRPLFPNYEARVRKKYEGRLMDGATCLRKLVRGEFFLWTSALKRLIIEENNLKFVPGCTYNEDTLFISQYLSCANTCIYVEKVLYGYRKNDMAATSRFTSKNLVDVMGVYEAMMTLAKEQSYPLSIELKKTAQCLALHIYEEHFLTANQKKCQAIFQECIRQPLLFEWKTMAVFGCFAEYLWKMKVMLNKIIRRL